MAVAQLMYLQELEQLEDQGAVAHKAMLVALEQLIKDMQVVQAIVVAI
jgi:hypothetical protein